MLTVVCRMLRDRWGSTRQRLGTENLRPFDACCLCLHTAQRPVCCAEGHLFCKVRATVRRSTDQQECILSDLVAQRRMLADESRRREAHEQADAERAREAQRQADAERVAAFEQQQTLDFRGKRKREDDSETPRSNAAFWVPGQTPDAGREAGSAPHGNSAPTPLCIAGERPHSLTAKQLRDVHFTARTVDGEQQQFCPSCKKEFTRTSTIHVLRRCGHAFCAPCATQLIQQPARRKQETACPECSTPVQRWEKDAVALVREGTGFAAGGKSEVAKHGVAFQG